MRTEMRIVQFLLLTAVLLVFAGVAGGCTNLFQAAYVDRLGQPVTAVPALEHADEPPRLMFATHLAEDVRGLVEEGYVMMGYSWFNAEALNAAEAVEWGQTLHAQVVLLSQVFTNAEIDAMPVTAVQYYGGGFRGRRSVMVESGVTGYVPYTVNRYNYDASYWVKEKMPVLGARVYDLTPELRQQLQRNKGVVVYAVVKGSPAWDVGLLPGDAVTAIGTREIGDAAGFQEAVQELAGQKTELKIMRGGQARTLAVTLRAGEAMPATAPATAR